MCGKKEKGKFWGGKKGHLPKKIGAKTKKEGNSK